MRCIVVVFLFVGAILDSSVAIASETQRLTVFCTNDWHGCVASSPAKWLDPVKKPMVGGPDIYAAYLASTVPALQASGVQVIILDGGDFFQGSPEVNNSQGRLIVEIMNAWGVSAAAIGNHEFDYGFDAFRRAAAVASFSILSANLGADHPCWQPYTTRQLGSLSLVLAGCTTLDLPKYTRAELIRGLTVEPDDEALRRIWPVLASIPADMRILLSHCGAERDRTLARLVPGFDLLVGGHTNTEILPPERIGSTWVVQTRGMGTTVARLDFSRGGPGQVWHLEHWERVVLDGTRYGHDVAMQRLLQPHREKAAAQLDLPLGTLQHDVPRMGVLDSGSANLIADALRAFASVPIAIQNRGGARVDMAAGTITGRHLYQLSPFDNTIVILTLTGHELVEVLEAGLFMETGPVQVSGIEVTLIMDALGLFHVADVAFPDGSRLEASKQYKVVTNNFLAEGRDGFTMLASATLREDTGNPMRDALAWYVRKQRDLVAPMPRYCVWPDRVSVPLFWPVPPTSMNPHFARVTRGKVPTHFGGERAQGGHAGAAP